MWGGSVNNPCGEGQNKRKSKKLKKNQKNHIFIIKTSNLMNQNQNHQRKIRHQTHQVWRLFAIETWAKSRPKTQRKYVQDMKHSAKQVEEFSNPRDLKLELWFKISSFNCGLIHPELMGPKTTKKWIKYVLF
jgi:hypothetical protein